MRNLPQDMSASFALEETVKWPKQVAIVGYHLQKHIKASSAPLNWTGKWNCIFLNCFILQFSLPGRVLHWWIWSQVFSGHCKCHGLSYLPRAQLAKDLAHLDSFFALENRLSLSELSFHLVSFLCTDFFSLKVATQEVTSARPCNDLYQTAWFASKSTKRGILSFFSALALLICLHSPLEICAINQPLELNWNRSSEVFSHPDAVEVFMDILKKPHKLVRLLGQHLEIKNQWSHGLGWSGNWVQHCFLWSIPCTAAWGSLARTVGSAHWQWWCCLMGGSLLLGCSGSSSICPRHIIINAWQHVHEFCFGACWGIWMSSHLHSAITIPETWLGSQCSGAISQRGKPVSWKHFCF